MISLCGCPGTQDQYHEKDNLPYDCNGTDTVAFWKSSGIEMRSKRSSKLRHRLLPLIGSDTERYLLRAAVATSKIARLSKCARLSSNSSSRRTARSDAFFVTYSGQRVFSGTAITVPGI